ncbi:MAG TPA: aminomethyl-transferring glycine dehydrogenase subunit GcvPA, partial [Chloroflexota bacterium]|nr:aminomethyl-transferring glycine dehydrogenase subunit GcvPA [Chloroflexota bacterium]
MPSYVPTTTEERQAMLDAIGVTSIADLFKDIPSHLYRPDLDVPAGLSELETLRHLRQLSELNLDTDHYPNFLGAGAYRHFTPSIIGPLITRGEFLTSYTPYQPEVSQGTLQSIYEWQSLVCELTGMDVSNAAVYDAATGVGEAARMACALTRRKRVLVLDTVNPLYREVLKTYAEGPGIDVTTVSGWTRTQETGGDRLKRTENPAEHVDDTVACLIIQQPNFLGWLENVDGLAERLKAVGAILVVVADPAAMGLLRAPGTYGAGIVVGEGKWTGGPLDFGGPLVGMFACRQEYVRQMPGRIVGATVDGEGRRGFVLTLATREQHIRREKATSNICTSEALIALATSIYLCEMGKEGLRQVA